MGKADRFDILYNDNEIYNNSPKNSVAYYIIKHMVEKLNYKYEDDEINANIRYVQWKNNLSNEYSRYYFEDEDERFKLSMTTTLNKKGDNFYHSVFVSSNLFEDFYTNDTIEGQIPISGYNKDSKEFKTLKLDIDKFLRKKRKPHIKRYAEKLIEKYNEDKIFPEYNENNVLDKLKEY